jgi:hypothetical protein
MHVQTHIMSGWCVGNLFRLTPRQRLMCMIAASIADLDGLGILAGQEAYLKYHHVVGHNLLFGLIACIVLALLSRARLGVFALYLALFHLHLVMDFFGSGPGWPIYYLWPYSKWTPDNRHWSWEFYSWQNITAAFALLAWTILIAVYAGRTPLEVPMPRLDRQLVQWFRARFGRTNTSNQT